MSNSSYQTLARYDDCSYRKRLRGLVDIRQHHRDILFSTRVGKRHTKHLINRRVIGFCDEEQEDCYSHDSGPGSTADYDEHDYVSTGDSEQYESNPWTENTDICPWTQLPPSTPRSESSSPSTLSVNSSEYPSIHSDIFRLPTPQSTPSPKPMMIKSRINPVSRKQLLQSRKQITASHYDLDAVRQDFHDFQINIQRLENNLRTICDYVRAYVQVIVNAISCPSEDISESAIALVGLMIQRRMLDIQTIYFILQQGVMLSIRQSLLRHNANQLTIVVHLIENIIYLEPRAVPYLTELMYGVQIFTLIDDTLCYGTRAEIEAAFKLYIILFQNIRVQLENGSQPVLPDEHTQRDTQSYNSISTLRRILRPRLLEIYSNNYLKQADYVEPELLRNTMHIIICALCLDYTQLSKPQRDIQLHQTIVETLLKLDLPTALRNYVSTKNHTEEPQAQQIVEQLLEFANTLDALVAAFPPMSSLGQ